MADQDSRFSTKEVEYMANMLLSLKGGELKNEMIDIPKFARKSGLAEGSARNVLARLRKKIAEQAQDDADSAPPTPTPAQPQSKKTGAGRKKVAKAEKTEDDAGDDEEGEE